MELLMERMMKQMVEHVNKEMLQILDKCAEKVIKMLNKTGVMYKLVKEEKEEQECVASTHSPRYVPKYFMDRNDSDSNDDVSILGSHRCDEDTFPAMNIKEEPVDDANFVTPVKENGVNGNVAGLKGSHKSKHDDAYYSTPGLGSAEDPIIIAGNLGTPQSSSEVPLEEFPSVRKKVQGGKEDEVTLAASDGSSSFDSLKTICQKAIESGKMEQVVGKRKRTVPSKLKSPFVVQKPCKRQNCVTKKVCSQKKSHGRFSYLDRATNRSGRRVFSNMLEVKESSGKKVYQNALGNSMCVERIQVILNHQWLSGDVSLSTTSILLFCLVVHTKNHQSQF